MKEFVSFRVVAMKTGKVTSSVTITTVSKKKNASSKILILYMCSTTEKLCWLNKN